MVQRFVGKRVLVTGSGRGIGSAIAHRFAAEGARVYLTARGADELSATREELLRLSPDVRSMAIDLMNPDAAERLATDVVASWQGLDILVTNAGAAPQGSFLELKDEDWSTGFGLKMFANLRVIKQCWHLLKQSSGHLVMIGGGTARTPERHLALVSAVNGGQAALAKSIAEQGLIDNVHVNLVQPGTIKTSRRAKLMQKLATEEGVSYDKYMDDVPKKLRIQRLGEPSDVAELVTFLSTEETRWIHGTIVDVDGGQNKGI